MDFSKALKCSSKPVNRGTMILEHSACAECGKNHFACDADQCIDTKVKCPKGGASFVLWSKNPVIYLGYVKGHGQFWK